MHWGSHHFSSVIISLFHHAIVSLVHDLCFHSLSLSLLFLLLRKMYETLLFSVHQVALMPATQQNYNESPWSCLLAIVLYCILLFLLCIVLFCIVFRGGTIPETTMRYVSRYLSHDAIRIAILVYRVNRCLDLQFVDNGNATHYFNCIALFCIAQH